MTKPTGVSRGPARLPVDQYTECRRCIQAEPSVAELRRRPARPRVSIHLDKSTVILIGIDADRLLMDDADTDSDAVGECPQLFELLQLFEWVRRQGRYVEEDIAAVGVNAHVLKEAGPLGRKARCAVADVGNGAATKIECTPLAVA